MRRTVAVVLALVFSACAAQPSDQVVHLRNDSDRALMLSVGGLLDGGPEIGVRPCGGEVSVPITADRYQEDGRLLASLAIDPTGAFDVAVAQHEGDPSDLPGTYTASIVWSDGTLAGRLPLYLTVSPRMGVTSSEEPVTLTSSACEPAY